MTEPITGEQKSTEKAIEDLELSHAVRIVKAAIAAEENRLRQIAADEENEPVLLEGETSKGYGAHILVEPALVARIMLDYRYPHSRILEEDAPDEMWDELARKVGLESVFFVAL